MTDWLDSDIIDCHTHMRTIASIRNQKEAMETCKLAAISVMSVPVHGGMNINQNVLGALFKASEPERVYWFGGLHHQPPVVDAAKPDFAGQLRRIRAMGCDGIKFIEGKPTVYKMVGTPLNDPLYDEFYAQMATERIPLLFHVADPPRNWAADRISASIKARGWFYGDGTFPTREQLYEQIDDILSRFEHLPLILAHFFFLGDDIERADEFLNRWPDVSFDLTPGWSMYGGFTKAPDAWREFFIRHQDQILFGTDTSGGKSPLGWEKLTVIKYRYWRMRAFLETDKPVLHENGQFFQGIHLPADVLAKIYHGNFRRLAGDRPRPVNVSLAIERCKELIEIAKSSGADSETRTDLANILAGLEQA